MTVDTEKLRDIVLRIIANRKGGDAVKAYNEGVALGFDMAVLMLVVRFTQMGRERFAEFDRILVAYLSAMELR